MRISSVYVRPGFLIRNSCVYVRPGFLMRISCVYVRPGFLMRISCVYVRPGFLMRISCVYVRPGFLMRISCVYVRPGLCIPCYKLVDLISVDILKQRGSCHVSERLAVGVCDVDQLLNVYVLNKTKIAWARNFLIFVSSSGDGECRPRP